MAPKRGRKVVKTTKVIQETVEVVSLPGSQSQEDPTHAQPEPEVIERREQTSVTKSIPIEDDNEQETETQELDFAPEEPKIDKIATPPREEAPPRQEQEQQQEEAKARPDKRAKKEIPKPKDETQKTKKAVRKRGKRMVEGGEGYKRYVFRVLKQVHPGMAITSGAMTVVNSFMNDMFERLASEASKLNMQTKKATMSAREIQGAVKLVLPGELGKHAIAEGSKAVTNYVNYGSNK